MKETDLYAPVKAYLEGQGYNVKAEVKDCDVVALRGDEAPVVVELKTSMSMALLLQGMDRLSITDAVYIAIPRGKGRAWYAKTMQHAKLCRRIGLGLLSVRVEDGLVEAHADPVPYVPRKNGKRKTLLLREFEKREGDPNIGGQTRTTIVTAYRQDALRLAEVLRTTGPRKPSDLAKELGIPKARQILASNHYGWFVKVERGIYGVLEGGGLT